MEQNHESSFWRSNMKMVPGRPSPTKDLNRSMTVVKAKTNNISNPSTSFEKYQKSVSDAWTLSEDELTKEYCILSDDTKMARRATQNMARALKNPIAVVHRHQASSSSSPSALPSITTTSATSSNATHNTLETTIEEDEDEKEDAKPKPVQRKVSSEKSYEYG